MGQSLQLLPERRSLGAHVRPHMSLLSVHGAGLPESASLARDPDARGEDRLPAMHQCLPPVRQPKTSSRTRRLTYGKGLAGLRQSGWLTSLRSFPKPNGRTTAASIACSSPKSSTATISCSISEPLSTPWVSGCSMRSSDVLTRCGISWSSAEGSSLIETWAVAGSEAAPAPHRRQRLSTSLGLPPPWIAQCAPHACDAVAYRECHLRP